MSRTALTLVVVAATAIAAPLTGAVSFGEDERGSIAAGLERASQTVEAQPRELRAEHRFGQTFITWRETSLMPDAAPTVVAVKTLRQELDQRSKLHYRVYRSTTPIVTLKGLKPIAEVPPFTGWNTEFSGVYPQPGDKALRYVIEDGKPPLAADVGLYVHNPSEAGQAYYAVTASTNGRENVVLTPENVTGAAVAETVGAGKPVLQREEKADVFIYVPGPHTLRFYVRWEAPPNFSVESQPFDYLVALPKALVKPAPVMIGLHAWGGHLQRDFGWWHNAEKGTILLTTNMRPYDWWSGFHEHLFTSRSPKTPEDWQRGVVRPYPQRRLLSILDWMATSYSIDLPRSFISGSSMGGSGSIMLGLRYPERVAWVHSWVGIHRPRGSPTFKASYDEVFGRPELGVKFEEGTPVWDYFDDVWYLRRYPERSVPLIVFSNGKNDANIGWTQAVEFVRALQETRQPHIFFWGQNGHGERSLMPGGHPNAMPLDLRSDRTLPAFSKSSLDDDPGDGSPDSGAATGQMNAHFLWETSGVVDQPDEWSMTIGLFPGAPQTRATVSVTPRRTQMFKLRPGDRIAWTNRSVGGPRIMQTGEATADQWGLVTIEGVATSTGKTRLQIRGVNAAR